MLKKFLNGNALKVLGCIFMLCDHLGYFLFPECIFLRYIGRLAFPIFAFLIAEGCKYTHNKQKYFLLMAILGVAMMLVQYIATAQLLGNIFITFSLAIILIYLLQYIKKLFFDKDSDFNKKFLAVLVFAVTFLAIFALCQIVDIDYGFCGVLVPLLASLPDFSKIDVKSVKVFDNLYVKLLFLALGLVLLAWDNVDYQWFSLFSLLLLASYNGQRGKLNLKYFFYVFYPLHIVVLYGLQMIF